MNEELKPCLCGSEVEMYQKGQNTLVIHCLGCGLERKKRVLRYSIEWLHEKMIEQWNTRPIEDALRKQLEVAGMVIKKLLSNLPDSIRDENESWQWCWDELNGEAQDDVKSARDQGENALAEIAKLESGK